MRKIVSMLILIVSLVLVRAVKTNAQEISLPREVAEYYYEQKKENDLRKEIIKIQDSIIAKQVERIGIQDALLEIKDQEIKARLRIEYTYEAERKLTNSQLDYSKKETKEWKLKTGVAILIALAGLIL